ncbi:MAG TPA: sugar nucleotide-binding protein [Ktedonobacteraceae bacterium]|jgi:dTDP-4-dehydrorhamnose reductase|nr:sugar nucleotide-binding protein [Ktedonobacteraceae bacterium]
MQKTDQYQRVLLLGSTGYLGSALMAHLQPVAHVVPVHRTTARFPASHPYDFWTDSLASLITQHRVDLVIIAANMAYEAADATCDFALFKRRVDQLVRDCQACRVLYISSDGIFAGKKGQYKESDIPTPSTLYGRNLQYFEQAVQAHCTNYCIVRPSYLYGYSGSQLDQRLSQVRDRLLSGEQLRYFTDMIKSPMDVNQVTQAIVSLARSDYVGIVHVAGEAMSVYDFYLEAMRSLGVTSPGLFPAHMPTDFPYPRDTSLDSSLMKKLTGIVPLSVHEALSVVL